MDEDVELAARIGHAWRELRRGASMSILRDLLQGETGLDLGQLDTLEHLVLSGGGRMGDVADALRIDASTATRAIARLVDAGFAERVSHPDDARCVVVRPTPAGSRRYEELAASRRESMIEMISDFELDDRRQLADGMEKLVAALDAFVERRTATSAVRA